MNNKLPIAPAPSLMKSSFEANDALKILAQADKIRKDKPLMREVKTLAKTQARVVSKKR